MAIAERTAEAFADLPPIVVVEEQFDEISEVSELLIEAIPEVCRFLERELERARLVPSFRVPLDVVTVGFDCRIYFRRHGSRRTSRIGVSRECRVERRGRFTCFSRGCCASWNEDRKHNFLERSIWRSAFVEGNRCAAE